MSTTYEAEKVDPIITDLYNQLENALLVAKNATERQLAGEAAHQVELQKVAHQRVAVDPALVDNVLQTLEDLAIVRPEGREKLAADLSADPNNPLRFLQRVVTISAGPQEGTGIPKSATAVNTEADPDGWDEVITKGA